MVCEVPGKRVAAALLDPSTSLPAEDTVAQNNARTDKQSRPTLAVDVQTQPLQVPTKDLGSTNDTDIAVDGDVSPVCPNCRYELGGTTPATRSGSAEKASERPANTFQRTTTTPAGALPTLSTPRSSVSPFKKKFNPSNDDKSIEELLARPRPPGSPYERDLISKKLHPPSPEEIRRAEDNAKRRDAEERQRQAELFEEAKKELLKASFDLKSLKIGGRVKS